MILSTIKLRNQSKGDNNMGLAQDLDNFIRTSGKDVFIEAKGKISRLRSFYDEYNSKYTPTINDNTDGIIALSEEKNKWGLELRLYLHDDPGFISTTNNTVYRSEYSYRINDTKVIRELFDLGYRIGLN